MWPMFGLAIAADALIGALLPPTGESQALLGAALVAAFLNLLAVVLCSRPLGALIRRRRPDLPASVARDYGGTIAIAVVTLALLAAGLAHRPAILQHRTAKHDAIVRAQAFIGTRAPAEFRRSMTVVDVYAIEPGAIYRVCVPDRSRARNYCVVVRDAQPFPGGVSFDGYESNAVYAQGTS